MRRAAARWRVVSVLTLAALALLSLAPLVAMLLHASDSDLAFAGADGPFVADQFQYMSWIRQFGSHVLAANEFRVEPGERVFLHPMFLPSGLLWKAGVALPLAYLLWKPVAVVALFAWFKAYVERFLDAPSERAAALVTALFFASPLAALTAWLSLGSEGQRGQLFSVTGELYPIALLWGYLPAAISVALMTGFLLGAERLVTDEPGASRGRRVAWLSVCGALVSWLHPWQGETLLVTVVAAALLAGDWPRQRVLAGPAAATLMPLLGYFVLSRVDADWELAQEANAALGHVNVLAVAAALAPLALPALLAPHRGPFGFGEWALRMWPLAGLLVYLALSPSFAQHAFEGLSLPLAVLAVRGVQRLRVPAPVLAGLVALVTVPGTVYALQWFEDQTENEGQAVYLTHDERRAFDHLEDARGEGAVLASPYLGPLVPAETGRRVWFGHPSWTPDFAGRLERASALYGGELGRDRAAELVRSSGVAFVLAGCRDQARALDRMRPLVVEDARFGCARVYRVAESG